MSEVKGITGWYVAASATVIIVCFVVVIIVSLIEESIVTSGIAGFLTGLVLWTNGFLFYKWGQTEAREKVTNFVIGQNRRLEVRIGKRPIE